MPGRREENVYKNNKFSLYNLYGHAPAQEPPAPGVMKFTILEDPFLVIITTCIFLVCLFCVWV